MSSDEAAAGSNELPIELGDDGAEQVEGNEVESVPSDDVQDTNIALEYAPIESDDEAIKAYHDHMKVLYQLDHPSVFTEDVRKRLSSLHTIEQDVVQTLNEASAIISDIRNAPSVDDLKTRYAPSDEEASTNARNPINNYFRLISDIRRNMRREIIALKAANLLPTNVNAKYEWIAQNQEHNNAIWTSTVLDKLTGNRNDTQESENLQDVDMQEN